jgi:hypothetical protein
METNAVEMALGLLLLAGCLRYLYKLVTRK